MTKFNEKVHTPIVRTTTHEGAPAWQPPVLADLAFTAATTYANEDTFYELGEARLERLVQLVRDATDRDPSGVAWFVRDLRERFSIRGASILVAAEYANRVRELNYPRNAPDPADVIDSALQRGDEPAEFVAYWQSRYGPEVNGRTKASLPRPVKRGLETAMRRLYTEKTALKWDSKDRRVRMADVIELAHPVPVDERQGALFKYLLDERHHGDGIARMDQPNLRSHMLPMIVASHELGQIEPERRRETLRMFGPDGLAARGYTWERLSGWLPGGMDAEAWEAIIPKMGVFALIRNLRNFDDAGISEAAVDQVIRKITSAEDVLGSRILPYRAWSAYNYAPSDNWKRALGTTLDLASSSAPRLNSSLIVIDTSASMNAPVSARSKISRVTLAALQAVTVAKRSDQVDVVIFGDRSANIDELAPGWRRWSVLQTVTGITNLVGVVGHATYGHHAIATHFDANKHKHVLLFTEDQMHDSAEMTRHVPHITTFNVGGYGRASTWGKGRVHVAGFSDQVFQVVAELVT